MEPRWCSGDGAGNVTVGGEALRLGKNGGCVVPDCEACTKGAQPPAGAERLVIVIGSAAGPYIAIGERAGQPRQEREPVVGFHDPEAVAEAEVEHAVGGNDSGQLGHEVLSADHVLVDVVAHDDIERGSHDREPLGVGERESHALAEGALGATQARHVDVEPRHRRAARCQLIGDDSGGTADIGDAEPLEGVDASEVTDDGSNLCRLCAAARLVDHRCRRFRVGELRASFTGHPRMLGARLLFTCHSLLRMPTSMPPTRTQRGAPPSNPPVQPGRLSPMRPVPDHITRPPYIASGGDPGEPTAPLVRPPAEIQAMRRAGALAADILVEVAPLARPGVTTDDIDAFVHDLTIAGGAYPSPLGYLGYPKSVCTSVNEVICHGIPDNRELGAGDIVNIDVTVYLDGVHGDTSMTFAVGPVDAWSSMLVRETYAAMNAAIAVVGPGAKVNDIGATIEAHAARHGLGVVREFLGHAIGTEFHGSLSVPHYFDPRLTTRLVEGMTFTIEPMLTLGSPDVWFWDDDWTAVTDDGCRTAQFEHTVLVTSDGVEILTKTSDGQIPAELVGR